MSEVWAGCSNLKHTTLLLKHTKKDLNANLRRRSSISRSCLASAPPPPSPSPSPRTSPCQHQHISISKIFLLKFVYFPPVRFLRILGSRKKSSFLINRATKRGGGLNGCASKEKSFFFNVRKKVPMATKP